MAGELGGRTSRYGAGGGDETTSDVARVGLDKRVGTAVVGGHARDHRGVGAIGVGVAAKGGGHGVQ